MFRNKNILLLWAIVGGFQSESLCGMNNSLQRFRQSLNPQTALSSKIDSADGQEKLSPFQRWAKLSDNKDTKNKNLSLVTQLTSHIKYKDTIKAQVDIATEEEREEERERDKIKSFVDQYSKQNNSTFLYTPKRIIDSFLYPLLGTAKATDKNFITAINSLIQKNSLGKSEVDKNIQDAEQQINEKYYSLKSRLHKSKDDHLKKLLDIYFNTHIKKTYHKNYFADSANKIIKNLELNAPQKAAQQPLFIERNKNKDIKFYTDLFGILEDIAIEPVKTEEMEEYLSQQSEFVTSKIEIGDLKRFIWKETPGKSNIAKKVSMGRSAKSNNTDESSKVDESKQKILENVYNCFDWINGVLKEPHLDPNSDAGRRIIKFKGIDSSIIKEDYNQWFNSEIIEPLISQENSNIDIIKNNFFKFIDTSKEQFSDRFAKDACVVAAIQYISKDILQNKDIANIILNIFIPLTVVIKDFIKNRPKAKSVIPKAKIIQENNKDLLQKYSLEQYFDKLIKEGIENIDRSILKVVFDKSLDDFKENVMRVLLEQSLEKNKQLNN